MKKIVVVIILLLCLIPVFAWQKTYNDESEQYKKYLALKRISGTQQPIPTLPISADQLNSLLRKLDTSSFSADEKEIYDQLLNELSTPSSDFGNDENLKVNLKGWVSVNSLLRTGTEKIINDTKTKLFQIPVGSLNFDLDITKFFHMKFDLDAYVYRYDDPVNNFNFWSLEKMGQAIGRYPYTDYISFGSSYFNFVIGRDRLSAGTGNTGNLGLSHNLLFHDFFKASVVYSPVSLDTTIIASSGENRIEHTHFDSLNLVCLHRLSWAPLKWMNLSLYEGCLQYGLVSALDVRFTNPVMILHNSYGWEEGTQNNFFGVDFNFALGKNNELTTQIFIDQLQMADEVNDEMGHLPPNAYGGLLAWNGSWKISKGLLNCYAETVYTSPALYLKEDHPEDVQDVNYYNVDLYLFTNSDCGYLGHQYGPDTAALSIGSSFETEKYSMAASASLKATGAFGFGVGQIDYTGWTEDYFSLVSPSSFDGKSVQYSLNLKLSGSYQIMQGIIAESALSLNKDWNHNHIQNNHWHDVQLYLGIKANILGGLIGLIEK